MTRLAACAALFLAACSNRPSASHCEHAVDHMIDIFVVPKVSSSEALKDAEVWKKNLKERDPVRGVMIETCRKRMTDAVASCVLAAQDEATLAACFAD